MNDSTTTVTQRQIMLCFAYLAYCGENITSIDPHFDSVEETIFGYLEEAMSRGATSPLTPITGHNDNWHVTWGPAVYTVPGALYQDNLMYVVQNQSDPTQYAIAIRGTNSSSDLDFLFEDFDVRQMMPWPNGNGAMISESTNIGLQILLNMEGAVNGRFSEPKVSLLNYLKTQTHTDPIYVGVTGHSLGGCLAPTLALYLNDNPSLWDTNHSRRPSILYAISFAGPTAGNEAFASYSNAQFREQYAANRPPRWNPRVPTNCDVVQCSLDIVPLAWVHSNVSNGTTSPLFDIYSPSNTHANPALTDPPYDSERVGKGLDFNYSGSWSNPEVNGNLSDSYRVAWTLVVSEILPGIAESFNTRKTQYTQLESHDLLLGAFYNSMPPPNTPTFEWPTGFTFPTPHEHGGNNSLTVFMKAFIGQAALQHVYSYPQLLDVKNLNEVIYQINSSDQ